VFHPGIGDNDPITSAPMDPETVSAFNTAVKSLARTYGWEGENLGNLPCHPSSSALTFVAHDVMVRVRICLSCLQSYIGIEGVLIGPPVQGLRSCHQCGRRATVEDFLSKLGTATPFCGPCRLEWARNKRSQEAQAAAAEARQVEELRRSAIDSVRRVEQHLAGD
jgi:hypothetical protein